MHKLERKILHALIRNPHLRYVELKPVDVEGNLFMYHLKRLINDDLVRKCSDGSYELTPGGKLFADKLQLDTFEQEQQPRIVILMAVRDGRKGWLFHKRKVQPVINMTGFFHANIKVGESIFETAQKRFLEMSGLRANFTYRGSGITTIYKDGELESYIIYSMLEAKRVSGQLKAETELGYNFWVEKPDFSDPSYIPGMDVRCKMLLESKQPFFSEQTYHI